MTQAVIAGRHALLTKILNDLVSGLASNGRQVGNKDNWGVVESFGQTQYIP